MTQAHQTDDANPAPNPKREAILVAAQHLFLKFGYGAVTMDAIAQTAKVSKRTVYSHFSSKEMLFAGLMTAMCDVLGDRALPAEIPKASPEEALTMLGRQFVDLVTSPNGLALFRIVVGEGARFPELGATFYETGPQRLVTLIATYLCEQDRAGNLRVPEPEIAAMQFLDLAKSSLHLRLLLGIVAAPTAAEKEQAVAQAVDCFIRAYAA